MEGGGGDGDGELRQWGGKGMDNQRGRAADWSGGGRRQRRTAAWGDGGRGPRSGDDGTGWDGMGVGTGWGKEETGTGWGVGGTGTGWIWVLDGMGSDGVGVDRGRRGWAGWGGLGGWAGWGGLGGWGRHYVFDFFCYRYCHSGHVSSPREWGLEKRGRDRRSCWATNMDPRGPKIAWQGRGDVLAKPSGDREVWTESSRNERQLTGPKLNRRGETNESGTPLSRTARDCPLELVSDIPARFLVVYSSDNVLYAHPWPRRTQPDHVGDPSDPGRFAAVREHGDDVSRPRRRLRWRERLLLLTYLGWSPI